VAKASGEEPAATYLSGRLVIVLPLLPSTPSSQLGINILQREYQITRYIAKKVTDRLAEACFESRIVNLVDLSKHLDDDVIGRFAKREK
jgi:hypothetical protein